MWPNRWMASSAVRSVISLTILPPSGVESRISTVNSGIDLDGSTRLELSPRPNQGLPHLIIRIPVRAPSARAPTPARVLLRPCGPEKENLCRSPGWFPPRSLAGRTLLSFRTRTSPWEKRPTMSEKRRCRG